MNDYMLIVSSAVLFVAWALNLGLVKKFPDDKEEIKRTEQKKKEMQ